MLFVVLVALLFEFTAAAAKFPKRIGFYNASFDKSGQIVPKFDLLTAIEMQFQYYATCNRSERGYPVFTFETFLDEAFDYGIGNDAEGTIPGTQLGQGIQTYLRYAFLVANSTTQRKAAVAMATKFGDYLVNGAISPSTWKAFPSVPRSTGSFPSMFYPLKISGQGDLFFGFEVIEPDKAAMAATSLDMLYEVTGNKTYHNVALHTAAVLSKTMRAGSNTTAPWSFRIDGLSGESFYLKNGNMGSILHLFDRLIERYGSATKSLIPKRNALYKWITEVQLNAPDNPTENLFVGFFEDKIDPTEINRNSWTALELARYFLIRGPSYEPNYLAYVDKLLNFALRHFSFSRPGNVTIMTEQDDDLHPWGSACSKLVSVAALYECRGGPKYYRKMAENLFAWMSYFVNARGCAVDKNDGVTRSCGGWQEDCMLAKVNNWLDAVAAFKGNCEPPY